MAPAKVWEEPTALLGAGATRARITRNISHRAFPSPRPTRRRFLPSHRKRQKPQRFSPRFRQRERLPACLSARASAGPCAFTRIELTRSASALALPSAYSLRACPRVFLSPRADMRPHGLRSSSCLFGNLRQASKLSTSPEPYFERAGSPLRGGTEAPRRPFTTRGKKRRRRSQKSAAPKVVPEIQVRQDATAAVAENSDKL